MYDSGRYWRGLNVQRRRLLELGAGGCAAGLAGLAVGYKFHDRIRAVARAASKTPAPVKTPWQRFKARADRIEERHRKQTKEDVQALKAKYESPVLGKFRVWDLIEKLSLCIDPSDTLLGVTSQYVHVCQILQVMEKDKALDETMLLTALLPLYDLRFHFDSRGMAEVFDHGIVWIEYVPVWALLAWEFVNRAR